MKPLQSEAKVSKLMDVIQKNTELRLDDFKSMDEVYRYVDAIASSGSTEEAKGCVFVLGNTSSGKSSLVQTLRNYSKDKAKTPKPVLSGDEDNKAYLETRVLDIVENVKLHRNDQRQLKVRREHNDANLGIIDDTAKEEPSEEARQAEEETLEEIEVSFVDFGGHTEYASCSPIFIKEKAVFLICFPVAKFKNESDLDDEYFPSIGTYIQLILENCDMPIIFLVATKGDEVKDSAVENNLSSVMATAKKQLEAIAKKSRNKKPFIFHRVIQTSLIKSDLSKNADLKSILDKLMDNLFAVFGHSDLMDVQLMAVPKSWRTTIDHWRSTRQKITIDEAVLDFQKRITEDQFWVSKAGNVEVSAELDKWKNVAQKLVTSTKENGYQNYIQNHTSNSGRASALETYLASVQEGPDETFEPNSAEKLGVLGIKNSIQGYLCWTSKRLTGDDDIIELSDIHQGSFKNEDKRENVKTVVGMFSFFSSGNEILWFR